MARIGPFLVAEIGILYLTAYKSKDRPALKKMIHYVRQGDVVIVESISRFARNTKDLLELMEQLSEKQVAFISKKEAIDTTIPSGKFMLTIFGAVAELERDYILQRQREGIEIAKQLGKYHGRKQIEVDPAIFQKVCSRWRGGEITATAAMKQVGLKPSTFYRMTQRYGL